MEKFIPYEKLSKKKKKERNSLKRKSWGEFNPAIKKIENRKAYKRKNQWDQDDTKNPTDFFILPAYPV